MTDHNGRITPAQEKLVRDTPAGHSQDWANGSRRRRDENEQAC